MKIFKFAVAFCFFFSLSAQASTVEDVSSSFSDFVQTLEINNLQMDEFHSLSATYDAIDSEVVGTIKSEGAYLDLVLVTNFFNSDQAATYSLLQKNIQEL